MDTILHLSHNWSLWFGIGIALIGLVVLIPFLLVQRGGLRGGKTDSHGSAHFARSGDIKPLLTSTRWQERRKRKRAEVAGVPAPSNLVLGTFQGKAVVLDEETLETHVLMIAPTGAGKTSRVILPGLLREEGRRSLFVIDPKQELVRKSAGYIAQHHEVWMFAPTDPTRSHRYNPLAYIETLDDARDFAMSWIQNTGVSKEPFWDRAAELLITATILHLRTCERDAPFSRLAKIFSGMSFEQIQALLKDSKNETAREMATSFLSNMEKNDKLVGSVLTDIANRFFMLFSPEIAAATAENDIDFSAMADRPIALYLSIPFDDAERLRPLSATFIMQMMRTWIRRADRNPWGQLPRAIGCYLDELANVGRIPHFESYISTLRSKRVGLLMAIQAFSQLEEVYGPAGKETIISNSRTKLLLPGAGLEECKYFSELTGETTAVAKGQSKNMRGMIFADSESFTKSETARPLMTPDEIRTMPEGSILMVSGRLPAVLVESSPYFETPALVARSALALTLPERPADLPPLTLPEWFSELEEVVKTEEEQPQDIIRPPRRKRRGRGGKGASEERTQQENQEPGGDVYDWDITLPKI
ncbi:type IV secretory system conjugative DNA transfer family protein [Ktedonobacter racemifer]|uniref:TRAG family protein n=1 Tax=Ktedonobacter racemifer DSM 44963 TaxID=485913 RepID=D6U8U4_KTERA|nr:type IV secretory system conjugative DNA transfer family protein [Ktedonobacter racemifer]EFH79654.1 TRAG family protein [Ktedonobacter racemifer DSM 44963]